MITNPEICNRGPYTQFCGYFYTCRTKLIRQTPWILPLSW